MNDVKSLKDSIYESMLNDIIEVKYLPGEVFSEKQIIEKFKCSKSPVREALQALCSDGFLCCLPRYGYTVVQISSEELESMMEFRQIVECSLLKKNYRNISPYQIKILEEISNRCYSISDDSIYHWNSNLEFHIKLIEFGGNTYASKELTRCLNTLTHAYMQYQKAKTGTSEKRPIIRNYHHKKIIECLKKGDGAGAVKYLRLDLDAFC